MIEGLLGLTAGISLTDLGILAALTTIITEVLKAILPKEFPTQVLTVFVSLFLTVGATVATQGPTLGPIITGVLFGFIIAFVSMKGFDALKEVFSRYTIYALDKVKKEEENGDDNLYG